MHVKYSLLLYASLPEAQLWSESLIPTTADFLQPESKMIHMAFQPLFSHLQSTSIAKGYTFLVWFYFLGPFL